jgi:hypothetical protein
METARKKKVLFVGGSMNQTTQMFQIYEQMKGEVDAWFSPFWGTEIVAVLFKLGLLDWTIAGGEWRRSTLEFCRDHGLQVDDHGKNLPYDLVVKCQDIVRQSNLDDQRVVLVQEGMTDPENLMFELVKRFDFLPRWLASTAATGLSHRYVKFCVASEGYRDLFVRKGVDASKIEVTGIPNFDDMVRFRSCAPLPIEGYALVVTSDARETFKLDDRMRFLRKAKALAAGRQMVFKLHPNENHARATAEILSVDPTAIVATNGKAEELIAGCALLITEYSTCSYVGIALGKEVHSNFDADELRRLMPLQHGNAARNIAAVCREVLGATAPARIDRVRRPEPSQPIAAE